MSNKKNFDPALDFLSQSTKTAKGTPGKKNRSEKPKAEPKKEIKSRRVQLVLKQSLYDKLAAQSWKEHKSVNEYISDLLEKNLK